MWCSYCKTYSHTTEECASVIKASKIGTLYRDQNEWRQSPTLRGRWQASRPAIQNLPNTPAAKLEMAEYRVNQDAQLADLIKYGHAITLDGKHVPYETVRKTEEDQ